VSHVLAYFLTWRCYGNWLHGDDRGSVDRFNNQLGAPLLPPDPARVEHTSSLLAHEPFSLSPDARAIVEQTIRRHSDIRGWTLLATNPRSTHVHTVVNCHQLVTPETAMNQFKVWCTRRLREARLARPDQKLWAEHGSTRWIDTDNSLAQAIDYVLNHQ
jgi:hypothetical protein